MIQRILVSAACALALLVVAALALVATTVLLADGSVGATLQTGRCITATSDAFAISLVTTKDAATIRTAGRTILVAPTEMLIDGRPVVQYAKEAQTMSIRVDDGHVSLVADGHPLGVWPK